MKLPFVRRATVDALRAQLARAEQDAVARAAERATEQARIEDLKAELHNACLTTDEAKDAYDVANSRAMRAERQVTKLKNQIRALQTAQEETVRPAGIADQAPSSEQQMTDRQYGLSVLNQVLPMAAEAIKQNDGSLPDDYWKGLSVYVTNAPNFGVTDDEIEELRVAYGIPAAVIQKAKNLARTA